MPALSKRACSVGVIIAVQAGMHRNLCGTYVEVVVNLNHGRVNTRAKAFDFKQAEHAVRAGSYNHET